MKFIGHKDKRTNRIAKLELEAETFSDETLLTRLINAVEKGTLFAIVVETRKGDTKWRTDNENKRS